MTAGPRLGIDFGTSHTVALLAWPDGRVRPLLFDGSPLLPSSVFAQTDGQLLVGRDAVHAARVEPSRFEASPKRRIDDGTVLLGDKELAVPALIAAVLTEVAREATRVGGGPPSALTLTHPASWGVSRRLALLEGAKLAGLPQPALMPEPVAAAHYFAGVLRRQLAGDQGLLIYDFGGGTFDASIVTRSGAGFDVRAVDGIDDLGGIDLDALVVDYAREQLPDEQVWQRLTSPQTTEDRRHRRLLWDDARVAKEMLSRTASTGLHVPIGGADVTISRDAFEAKARPMLEQTVRTTAAVVRWSGLDKARLAGLFLVGGSSRIPLVATLLERELGLAPTVIEQPELVVAEGGLRAWVHPAGQGGQHGASERRPPAAPVSPGPATSGPNGQPNAAPAPPRQYGAPAAPQPAGGHQPHGTNATPVPQIDATAGPDAQATQPIPASPHAGTAIPHGTPPAQHGNPAAQQYQGAQHGPAVHQGASGAQRHPGAAAPVSPHATGTAPVSVPPANVRPVSPPHPSASRFSPPPPPPRGQPVWAEQPGISAQSGISAQPEISAQSGTRRSRNTTVPLLAGILMLVVVAAGALVYMEHRESQRTRADNGPDVGVNDTGRIIPAYERKDRPDWVPATWRALTRHPAEQLWRSGSEEYGTCETSGDRMRVTAPDNALTGCTLKPPLDGNPFTDVAVEVKVTVTSGCAVVWPRTGAEGYLLAVCQGYVQLHALGAESASNATLLEEWDIVGPAPGTVVGVLAQGSTISVYLGGKRFGSVENDRVKRGKANVGALGPVGKAANVTFEDFRAFEPVGGATSDNNRARTHSPSPTGSGWPSGSTSPSPSKKTSPSPTPTS